MVRRSHWYSDDWSCEGVLNKRQELNYNYYRNIKRDTVVVVANPPFLSHHDGRHALNTLIWTGRVSAISENEQIGGNKKEEEMLLTLGIINHSQYRHNDEKNYDICWQHSDIFLIIITFTCIILDIIFIKNCHLYHYHRLNITTIIHCDDLLMNIISLLSSYEYDHEY